MSAGGTSLVVLFENLARELGSASSVVLGLLLVGAGVGVLFLSSRRPPKQRL